MSEVKCLPEKDGHIIAYSIQGNPSGIPIVSFHGGPGSCSKPYHAKRYNLDKSMVILFDQRGCGKSTPLGELEKNTTQDILEDTERIREELGIDKWIVAGSSWGSTLALLYAIKYPERTMGIMISAVWTADRDSVEWSFSDPNGSARLMPDVWQKRMDFFNKFNIKLDTQNEDVLRLLETTDFETQQEVTAGVFNWEGNLFSVQSPVEYTNPEDIDEKAIASAKIFVHYDANHEFIPENYIMDNIDVIKDVPTVMVHGRYDILCPLHKATELNEKLNNSTLVVAHSSGHKLTAEGETIQKLAFDRFLSEI